MANERGTVHRASEKASSRCLRQKHLPLPAAKVPATACGKALSPYAFFNFEIPKRYIKLLQLSLKL